MVPMVLGEGAAAEGRAGEIGYRRRMRGGWELQERAPVEISGGPA